MTINVEAGWWLIPLAVTLVSYFLAYRATANIGSGGDYGMGDVATVFAYLAATVPALLSWLFWAIFT